MKRTCENDEGFALFIVLGAIVVITTVALAGYWLSLDTLRESGRVQTENRAFQVASSGLDRELQIFSTSNFINGVYTHAGSTPDGQYSVVAQATGNPYEYCITSVGQSANTTETVTERFFFMSLWDMNIGAGPADSFGGGAGWNGNASVRGPLYVRGKGPGTGIDWSANATLEGGPLLIRDGRLNVDGSGTVGEAKPIYLFATLGLSGNKAQSNVYLADGKVHSSVPDIQLPWVDDQYMQDMWAKAKDESCDNNMGSVGRNIKNAEATTVGSPSYPATATKAPNASTYYKYIGPSLGPSALGAGTTALSIGGASFGRYPGNGYALASGIHDDFAFDKTTGTLYVEGTVFIDGSLTIGAGVTRYIGNGALVVNGNVTISTSVVPANELGIAECLGIVTPGQVTVDARGNLNGRYMGAVFCNGQFSIYGTNTTFEGTVLAGQLYGDLPNILLIQNPIISRVLPESMPAAGGGYVFGGSWSRT